MAYANGQTRAWANNSTASAAATLVNKRYTFAALLAALQAATAATAANLTTGTLGNMLRKHMMTGAGQRMFEASFFGVGSDNNTGTCKVWFTKWDGNNFAVGLIVFAILVVINFVVVTKGAERIAEVVDLCRREGYAPPISNQPLYNLFDRGIEHAVLPVSAEFGLGQLAFRRLDRAAQPPALRDP